MAENEEDEDVAEKSEGLTSDDRKVSLAQEEDDEDEVGEKDDEDTKDSAPDLTSQSALTSPETVGQEDTSADVPLVKESNATDAKVTKAQDIAKPHLKKEATSPKNVSKGVVKKGIVSPSISPPKEDKSKILPSPTSKNLMQIGTRNKIAQIRAAWKDRDSRASIARGTKIGSPAPVPKIALLQGSEPVSTRLEMWEDRVDKVLPYSSATSSRTSISGPGQKVGSPPKESKIFVKTTANATAMADGKRINTPKPLPPLHNIFKGMAKIEEKPSSKVETGIVAKPIPTAAATLVKSKPIDSVAKVGTALPVIPSKDAVLGLKKIDKPTGVGDPNKAGPVVIPVTESKSLIKTLEFKESKQIAIVQPPKIDMKKIGIALPMMTADSAVMVPIKPHVPAEAAATIPKKMEQGSSRVMGAKLNFNPAMMMPGGMGKPMTLKDIKSAKSAESALTQSSSTVGSSTAGSKSLVSVTSTSNSEQPSGIQVPTSKSNVPKVASGIANVEKWGALGGAVADIIKVKKGEDPTAQISTEAVAATANERSLVGSPMTLNDFEEGKKSDSNVFRSFKGFSPDALDFVPSQTDNSVVGEGRTSEYVQKIEILPNMELHELLQPKSKAKPPKKTVPSRGRQ